MTNGPQETILVVDDEEDLVELVRYNLIREGFRVQCALSGEEAVRIALRAPPQLIVLDLMLPGLDGLEVCRLLKHHPETQNVPIIMLTAKGEEADVVKGLELGADDYISKPFSPKILVARIKAVLRRGSFPAGDTYMVIKRDDLIIYPERQEALIKGEKLDLTATEFRILHLLAGKPGWVFTRSRIVDEVRGEDYPVTERSVDVHIVSLRKKMGNLKDLIETVRGTGYKFKDSE